MIKLYTFKILKRFLKWKKNLHKSPHFKLMNCSSYVGGWKYKSGEPFICHIVNIISGTYN